VIWHEGLIFPQISAIFHLPEKIPIPDRFSKPDSQDQKEDYSQHQITISFPHMRDER
jgi:hypothetical protein